MLDHFNSCIEALGDALFGDNSSIEEFQDFTKDLDEEQEKEFLTAVNDALLITNEWEWASEKPFETPSSMKSLLPSSVASSLAGFYLL